MVQRQPVGWHPAAHVLILLAAAVAFAIYALIGFGTITSAHPDGFLGLGLVLLTASCL